MNNVIIGIIILAGGRIQSLKAYNQIEAVFQSKPAKSFGNMPLIRIWENLFCNHPKHCQIKESFMHGANLSEFFYREINLQLS